MRSPTAAAANPAAAFVAPPLRARAASRSSSSSSSSSSSNNSMHASYQAAFTIARMQQQQQQPRLSVAAASAAAEAEDSAATADGAANAEAEAFAVAMAKVADDTKAQDLVVLNVVGGAAVWCTALRSSSSTTTPNSHLHCRVRQRLIRPDPNPTPTQPPAIMLHHPHPHPKAPLISWTSYFVVCTVISKPQLLAVLARIEKAAEEDWGRQKQNSPGSSPWEVVDYGDGGWCDGRGSFGRSFVGLSVSSSCLRCFCLPRPHDTTTQPFPHPTQAPPPPTPPIHPTVVVHVFTPDQRDHYDIESFYASAEEVDLPFLDATAAGAAAGGRLGAGSSGEGSGVGSSWTKQL